MARPQQLTYLPLDGWHVFSAGRLRAKQTHYFRAGVILHEREGENDSVLVNVRKAERLDSFAEHADPGKCQFSHPNRSPDRIVLPESLVGKLRGDQADFAAHLHIPGIEEAPAQNEKPSNRLVTLRHSNKIHDALH